MRELKRVPRVWAEKIQQVGKRGTPDILACVRGRFVAIELKKSEDESPDRLQNYKLNGIKKADGTALVASPENKDDILALIRELAKGER